MARKADTENQTVLEDYSSSLNDLTFNSKPMINVLTMLAEENELHADGIAKVIRDRIKKVDIKLKMPSLYLLDSILKNVGGDYINILSKYMVDIFTNVFENGDEKIRMAMFKLRNTWPQYFPGKFLYELDLSVKELDPNWPVIEPPSSPASIHINPKFLVKSDKAESQVPDDSMRIARLRAQQQEEKLKAEERRIKEQLKKLHEEQQKLQRSRLEEERLKHEEQLKKQHADRERLIGEQQKQIEALKKIQDKSVPKLSASAKKIPPSSSPVKTEQVAESKNFDPRLAKRAIPVLVTEKPVGKDISDVLESVPLPAIIEASNVVELQQELPPKQQQEDPSSTPLAMPARHTELQVALISTEDHGTIDDTNPPSLPPKSNLIVEDSLVNSAIDSQINNSTTLADSQTLPSGELNTKKRLLREDEEKAEFSPKKRDERLTEVKQDASQDEIPVVAPPVKKRKSDESVNVRPNMFCVPMDIASSEEEGTSTVTQGQSTEALHGRQEVDKEAEGRENISPVGADGDAGSRFRKRNRSEWRKLMIEKAKLERRKRIPSEKELPRQMRVENHEELLDKLKMRLSSGEIKDEEHTALVKQLDLMYEVQKIRDTPEKRRTLTAADRVKMAKSVDDRSITSGSSPSKADKSDDLADRAGRLPSQKETNQDLIRQLREKRMNVEREQRESERRLKRDWNIEQLRAARRDRERKDRDRDSRARRGFDDRPDRRERESEADWRSRRRNNKGRGRGRQRATEENSRPRFSRDRDDGDRRERRPNRPEESSLKPVGSSHKQDVEKTAKIPDAAVIEGGEMESKNPGLKSVDESKENRTLIENEDQNDNLSASAEISDQGTESVEVSRPVENTDQSEIAPRELLNRDPLVLNRAVLGEEKDDSGVQRVPTEDHSKPGHQHTEETIPDLRDVRPGEGIRKGINAFKIPRKEKIAEEESGHEGSATREGLAGDIRMLSWRHQDDSDHPNNMERRGQRHNSSAPPRQPGINQRMLANNARRGTPSLLDDNFNPELTRDEQLQFQAEKRAVPWQSGPRRPMEPEFREGPHPMHEEPGFEPRPHREFERRPGYMEEPVPDGGPDYIPRPMNQDHPGRMPFHQEQTNRRLSPMRPGDESFRTRPEMNINEPEFGFKGQPGRRFRGPKQRKERFRGPGFRDPRFAGPRMAGPGIQYREFKEDGYREMDGPHFEHGGHPYEEHRDYGYEPERHQIPPDGHRNFMDRRPEFLNDRELIGPDSRYGRIEPGRDNFHDSIRRPPFEASRNNPEFDNRPPFSDEPGRPYQMEPDNLVQRPPDVIDHRDQHPRGFPNPAQSMEGFRPMPQDYQDRRMSPVVFDYAARQRAQDAQRASAFVNDQQPPPQYMHPPDSAGFATVNPLMQMIQNVKRNTGEPGSRTPDSQADSLPEQPQAPQSFIGVRELFQQLVSTGVIPTPEVPGPAQKSATPPPTLETQETFIPEIKFVIDDLKTRHVSVINTLYVGSQCSSCGLRYPESEKQLYRDHLDWHFRVNRREKENKRSVSRPWFYAVEQWTEMDDVVDVEESAKSNFFEAEIKTEEPTLATGNGSCSVLLGPDDSFCDICFDSFEQFWDEALEEWRYKEAIRVNGKTYHVTCYSDMESGGFQSGSEQDFQSEEEKLSPMAFTGLVNTESEEYLSPDFTNTTEMYPGNNVAYSRTLRPKTEPDDYRMYEGNARQLQNTGAGSIAVNVKTEPGDLRVDEDTPMPTSPIWAATVKTEPEEFIPEEIASRSLPENSDPEHTARSEARTDDGKSATSNDTSSINHAINDEIDGETGNFHADDSEMRNLEELSTGTGIVADASEVSCTAGESEEEQLYGNSSVNDTKSAAAIAVSDGLDNSTLESVPNPATLDGDTAIIEDTDIDLYADNNSLLEVENTNTEISSAVDVEKTLNVEEEGNDNEKTEEERLYGRAIEDEDGNTKSEQSLGSINDQIILESVTEDKEMKKGDKNIEFEGKPQS